MGLRGKALRYGWLLRKVSAAVQLPRLLLAVLRGKTDTGHVKSVSQHEHPLWSPAKPLEGLPLALGQPCFHLVIVMVYMWLTTLAGHPLSHEWPRPTEQPLLQDSQCFVHSQSSRQSNVQSFVHSQSSRKSDGRCLVRSQSSRKSS